MHSILGILGLAGVLLSGGRAMGAAICGDIDGSGTVTQDDGTLANRYYAGLEPGLATTGCNGAGILQCGDVDQDGFVGPNDWLAIDRAAQGLSSPCSVEGFGAATNRISTSPPLGYITVTSVNDTGAGTLRTALSTARTNHGGLIVFNLTGSNRTLVPASPLGVPPNTVIDGIGSGVTIDGHNITSNGTLRLYNSNTAVRFVRIRDAAADGIQIAPKDATVNIQDIAVQHVSVTKSFDGGIDVNGCLGLSASGCQNGTTSRVTLADNFIGANGTTVSGSNNGGGDLTKYGVTQITMANNFWEKNLRRNPLVDNRDGPGNQALTQSLADVRFSLVRTPQSPSGAGWAEVFETGAQVNITDSCFEGSSQQLSIIKVDLGGAVFTANNSVPPGYTEVQLVNGTKSSTPFGPAPCLSRTNLTAVFNQAGALPRDSIDTCVINSANYQAALGCP